MKVGKRGLSPVIASVLLILLVLTLASLLFSWARGFVLEKGEGVSVDVSAAELCGVLDVNIVVVRKIGGVYDFEVVNRGDVNISSLEFKVYSEGSSRIVNSSVGVLAGGAAEGSVVLSDSFDEVEVPVGESVGDGLVGLWHLNDNDMTDSSGNGNDGTQGGGLDCDGDAGKFSGGCEFDGVDDYIEVSDSASLQFDSADSFTISCWIKTDDGDDDNCVRTQNDIVDSQGLYGLRVFAGRVNFLIRDQDANIVSFLGSTFVNNDQWHYITGTRDVANDKLIIYVDGVQDDETVDTTIGSLDSHNEIYFGTYRDFGEYFNGTIDEVAIWNRGLSATEIQELYEGGLVDYNSESNDGGEAIGSVEVFAVLDGKLFGASEDVVCNKDPIYLKGLV